MDSPSAPAAFVELGKCSTDRGVCLRIKDDEPVIQWHEVPWSQHAPFDVCA